ncbi:hypothetical protein NDU88_006346 [Pleurodeles waltl]|uniref:Uncharacterized protein n=1 Tax=Pleurodeles waltl TaxID=8319 RepID=A0AAV7UPR1_PLEWA|nr:hypothetical protein NDU88_006346 [Pleurodeles waltl]
MTVGAQGAWPSCDRAGRIRPELQVGPASILKFRLVYVSRVATSATGDSVKLRDHFWPVRASDGSSCRAEYEGYTGLLMSYSRETRAEPSPGGGGKRTKKLRGVIRETLVPPDPPGKDGAVQSGATGVLNGLIVADWEVAVRREQSWGPEKEKGGWGRRLILALQQVVLSRLVLRPTRATVHSKIRRRPVRLFLHHTIYAQEDLKSSQFYSNQ